MRTQRTLRTAAAVLTLAVGVGPAAGEERADYYPIENGGGARAYCYSDRGLQLTPEGKVTACVHARSAPLVTYPQEGGSSGSAYCMEGKDIAFSSVNGKVKMCILSYPIRGLGVSGAPVQCAPESVARFREDGHIISCGKDAAATAPEDKSGVAAENAAVKIKTAKDDLEQREAGIFFQAALVNMITQFVDARLATDALLKADFSKFSVPQWNAEYDQTMAKWQAAGQAISFYRQTAGKIPATRLAAADAPGWRIMKVARELTRGELLAVYDAAPPGMKVATVAAVLNVDKDLANQILQDVREGVNKHLGNIADANQRAGNAFRVLSTGSKALITVGGVAATGGGSLALSGSLAARAAAAGEIGALAVNGADLVLDVADTAVNIGVRDPRRQYELTAAINNAKEWQPLQSASFVLAIIDIGKAVKGLDHVLDRREAWLNARGKKNIDIKKLEYENALKDFQAAAGGNMLSIKELPAGSGAGQAPDKDNKFVLIHDPKANTVRIVPMSKALRLEAYIKESGEKIKALNLSPEQTKAMENALAKYAAAETSALTQPEPPQPVSCSGLGYKECRDTPGCNATFSTNWYVCCNQSEAVDGFCPKPK